MAADKLVITPVLPEGAQAFEITPGEVKVLTPERVPGGTADHLEEFDTTSLILCTGDLGLYERVRSDRRRASVTRRSRWRSSRRRSCSRRSPRSTAVWRPTAIRSAPRSISSCAGQAGIESTPPDVPDLLAKSQRAHQERPRGARSGKTMPLAWAEARRAKRPLRIVMHGHWDQAWAAFARAAESINPEGPKAEDEAPKTGRNRIPRSRLDAPLQLLPIACPPMHLVLHASGTLHLGRLDQGQAGLSIWTQPSPIRQLRRSRRPSRLRAGSTSVIRLEGIVAKIEIGVTSEGQRC